MPKRLKLRRFRRGERRVLCAKLHDRKLPAWAMHRYRIIALVREGQSVFQASRQVGSSPKMAYLWVARFNQSGFRDFESSSNPEGRPSGLTVQQRQVLRRTAQKRPTDVGLPFTHWSMTKLQDYLVKRLHFPKVSPEWLRRLLHRAEVSWQHTKTWKQSHDPEFEAKKSVFGLLCRATQARCGRLLRSTRTLGTPPHLRNVLGASTPATTPSRHVHSQARHRTTAWLL